MRFLILPLLLTCLPLQAGEDLLRRPVIVGASLSDGFFLPELGLPFLAKSRELGLEHFLRQVRKTGGERIVNLGSNWMFVAPAPKGDYQIKKAREAKPTVVFAIDFLFWYVYGNERSRSEEDRRLTRLEFFEKGLLSLATLECPVVVGTIPDARMSVGVILAPAQYPGAETIAAANRRLERWIKEHPGMVKVDLAGFHRLAVADKAIEAGGFSLPAGKTRAAYLQRDLLHPTRLGIQALVEVAVAALQKGG